MTRTFVVPDVHGRYHLLKGLLERADLIDHQGARGRRDAVTVVQLGDLANCVAADRDNDLRVLRKARGWLDVVLAGNHEHPYLGGPAFSGFFRLPEVERAILDVPWRAAYAVGETLLTHAGVAHGSGLPGDAAGAEAELARAWATDAGRHRYFALIGRARGGFSPHGGVLWSDWSERRDPRLNQVHGHTVCEDGPAIRHSPDGHFAINLDCGGHHDVRRIVGLWLDEAGEPDGFVEYAT